MKHYAGLDVSLETTSICVVDEAGKICSERKVATCPDAITKALKSMSGAALCKVGMETGPLAVWLWNELKERGVPIVCMDARHANAALKMMPNKTDRADAAGLARIVRTGWYKSVTIKSRDSYVVRALLATRDVLIGIRVRLENQIRGLLKTFGVMFGKRVGGFARRAEEIVAGELDVAPEMKLVIETLLRARADITEKLKVLDRKVLALARASAPVRLMMSVPGVGAITALSVATAIDEVGRFRRSSDVAAYFGLTPRRYESGEISRTGRITKRGSKLTRIHLYEAANALLTRNLGESDLRDWGLRIAKTSGFKKAKVAVARKLATILHAMWKSNLVFRSRGAAA
jgi:transposase